MPDDDDGLPFVPEPLFCNGTRVYTLDQGLRFFRITFGPDNGLTERQARHWAALFGQATAMHNFIQRIAYGYQPSEAAALALLQDCQPKTKGLPFKRPPATQPEGEPA